VPRRRLDTELVRRGLATTRAEAQQAVAAGLVIVRGAPATKSASLVAPDEPLALSSSVRRLVSRGGDKLQAGLERFRIDPSGLDYLDAGASTGGFTDCLLRAGAARVVAVDVGYGQLAWRLRTDPRVTVVERTNVRSLQPRDLPFVPDIVVADLSFISLRTVLPALIGVASDEAEVVLLVKPQFEAGRDDVGGGGVVRDPEVWRAVLHDVVAACERERVGVLGVAPSPLRGPAGNVEFLLHGRRGRAGGGADLGAAVDEARELHT
jgi:23S rRNA (cytidine1920-2'-O)/16S rRNA (cytidine1409-2'-O)-methyltransferase